MTWLDPITEDLRSQPVRGYLTGSAPAAEPTALAAISLAARGHLESAAAAAEWLAKLQSPDGSVGVRPGEPAPSWPTGLALMAWTTLRATTQHDSSTAFLDPAQRALDWILRIKGRRLPRTSTVKDNTDLLGWPWAEGTPPWVEPTAMSVVALKAAGHGGHARTRDAVALLRDRLLSTGGCNYGNTGVFGRTLRPHLQPTGLSLLGLHRDAGEAEPDRQIEKSLDYLSCSISGRTGTTSLCWSLLGLAAHGRMPREAGGWLQTAAERTLRRDRSATKLALLVLADLAERSPLIHLQSAPLRLPREGDRS